MSPSEFQLRQALREGEGERPDAEQIIDRAVLLRAGRRHRVRTAIGCAAAAVVVLGAAGGVVALTRGGGKDTAGNTSNLGAKAPAAPALRAGSSPVSRGAGSAAGSSAGSAASASSAMPSTAAGGGLAGGPSAGSCPKAPEHLFLPGGGGIGQFGSTDPLLSVDVRTLQVCAYPFEAGVPVRAQTFTGTSATAIVSAINSAPPTAPHRACPANVEYAGGTIRIVGVSASGAASKPVIITAGCTSSQATNGTAVRYLGELPTPLLRLLYPAHPSTPSR